MRPERIVDLGETLELLATYGAIRAAAPGAAWLSSVAAAHLDPTGQWLCADRHWLRHVLPACDRLDLLRRTAIRDPLYRFHLDAMIAEVLEAIGHSARWQRLEELLFGRMVEFSARFAQLLQMKNMEHTDDSGIVWPSFRSQYEGSAERTFAEWDRDLWSDAAGGSAALFPVITELYIPLAKDQPVNVHFELHSLHDQSAALLARVIECAKEGECHLIPDELQPELKPLYNLGLPIRRWTPDSASVDRRIRVGLASPVRLLWNRLSSGPLESTPVVPANRAQLRQSVVSMLDAASCYSPAMDFWSYREFAPQAIGFIGFHLDQGWPKEPTHAPNAARLPSAAGLKGMALSRKRSPDVDAGLQTLAGHLLYGPLLQLLLLEALDRELGQETVALLFSRPDDASRRVDIRVFYRPTQEAAQDSGGVATSAYELGDFESVMGQLAGTLRIEGAGFAFTGSDSGFWTSALLALDQVGFLSFDDPGHRCAVSVEALDRLHGGELMLRVIRAGQSVRDCFRSCLNEMWNELEKKRRASVRANAE